MQAKATFRVDSWDEEQYHETEGARLLRARVTKSFEGDVEGVSTAELLMAHNPDGPAAYTAHEWFTGTVMGKQGSFVSQHGAADLAEGVQWTIVGGTGAGELAGIRGSAALVIEPDGTHVFTLDYQLD